MTPQLTPPAIALIQRQLARMGGFGGLDSPFLSSKKNIQYRDAGENPPNPPDSIDLLFRQGITAKIQPPF